MRRVLSKVFEIGSVLCMCVPSEHASDLLRGKSLSIVRVYGIRTIDSGLDRRKSFENME